MDLSQINDKRAELNNPQLNDLILKLVNRFEKFKTDVINESLKKHFGIDDPVSAYPRICCMRPEHNPFAEGYFIDVPENITNVSKIDPEKTVARFVYDLKDWTQPIIYVQTPVKDSEFSNKGFQPSDGK